MSEVGGRNWRGMVTGEVRAREVWRCIESGQACNEIGRAGRGGVGLVGDHEVYGVEGADGVTGQLGIRQW